MGMTVGEISSLLQKWGTIVAPLPFVNGNQEFIVLYGQDSETWFEYYLVLKPDSTNEHPVFLQKRGRTEIFKTPGNLARSSALYLSLNWVHGDKFGFEFPKPVQVKSASPKKEKIDRGPQQIVSLSPELESKLAQLLNIEQVEEPPPHIYEGPTEEFYEFRGTYVRMGEVIDKWDRAVRQVEVFVPHKEGLIPISKSWVEDGEAIFNADLGRKITVNTPVYFYP